MAQINTIIVLRNDSTTAWESSSYKLQNGEVGVGYMTRELEGGATKQVPIIKVGDGKHVWSELPQAEGVFEDDQILTFNFGRHITSNGFVNAGGKGMTTSEWLIDALSVTKEPRITKPDANISASFTPSSGEAGTSITKINWSGNFADGTYEYGSVENKDSTAAGAAANWIIKLGDTQIGTTEDGNYAQSLIMSDDAVSVTLSAEASLVTTNVRTPLNNVGAATSGKITTFADGNTKKTFSPRASVTGYRKMFVGSTTATALDSSIIRGLSLKSTQASTSQFEVTAKEGATNLIIACPTNSQGKNFTLSEVLMYSAGVWDTYTSKFELQPTVQVADARGGSNGLQNYNIYMYKFAALKGDTKFKIKLASANA